MSWRKGLEDFLPILGLLQRNREHFSFMYFHAEKMLACKYSQGFAPTNPNSNLPLSCGLQKQGVCRSTETLDKVAVAVTLTQLDPNNSHSPTRGFCVILLNYELLATTWCFKVAWPAEADGSVPIFSAGGKQERTTEKPQCSLNYWKIMQYSNKSLNCYKSSLLHFLLRQEVY